MLERAKNNNPRKIFLVTFILYWYRCIHNLSIRRI